MAKTNTIGKVMPAETLYLRLAVGVVKDELTGAEYEVSTAIGSMTPIVRSKASGRWFILSWRDITELARIAGIDDAHPTGGNGDGN